MRLGATPQAGNGITRYVGAGCVMDTQVRNGLADQGPAWLVVAGHRVELLGGIGQGNERYRRFGLERYTVVSRGMMGPAMARHCRRGASSSEAVSRGEIMDGRVMECPGWV